MRKDLIIYIDKNNALSTFRTETPIREDVSKIKKISEINDMIIQNGLMFKGGTFYPSTTNNSTLYFGDITPNDKTNTFERNIYIINTNDSACKINLSNKVKSSSYVGMVAKVYREDRAVGEELDLYVGPNQYRHLELNLRRTLQDTVEYVIKTIINGGY